MTDVRDLLPLYALGVLDEHETQAVDRAVAADPALAVELASLLDTAGELIAEPNPVEPDAEIQVQLMASAGAGRFASYADRLGDMFDVSPDRAHELLGLIERKKSWELPMPGLALMHFDGGPRCATADCGFVRIAPGGMFPPHKHRGEERSIVMSGHVRDMTSGRLLGPGDELTQDITTEHMLVCEGDEECVFASAAFDGIEIGGQRQRKSG